MKYEVTDFTANVLERSRTIPVLVDFWAAWCGPCKVLTPILERLAEKNKDRWGFAKVDTDKHQEIAAQYGIRSIPNVKLFVDGKVADEFTGALPEAAVVKWLEKALPNKLCADIEVAQRLIANGKTSEGQRILEDVVRQDPGNEQARVHLAGTFLSSDPQRALELVRTLEEHSEFFPMVEAIRTIGGLRETLEHPESLPGDPVKQTYLAAIQDLTQDDLDGALQKFIGVIRTNRYYQDDSSRKACIAIFRVLGEDHELTLKYRRDFSGALYR